MRRPFVFTVCLFLYVSFVYAGKGSLVIYQNFKLDSETHTCDTALRTWLQRVVSQAPEEEASSESSMSCSTLPGGNMVRELTVLTWFAPHGKEGKKLLEQFRERMEGFEIWGGLLHIEEVEGVTVHYTYLAGQWVQGKSIQPLLEKKRVVSYADLEASNHYIQHIFQLFRERNVGAYLDHLVEVLGAQTRADWENAFKQANTLLVVPHAYLQTVSRDIEVGSHSNPIWVCEGSCMQLSEL